MALLLALGACSEGSAGAGQPASAAGSASSYHLITQLRPESVDGYFARQRQLHKLCATAAADLGKQVTPFPAIPADFVAARSEYASDGRRTVARETEWTMDSSGFAPEKGCALRLTSYWKSAVTQDGKERAADWNEEAGLVVHEAQPASAEAVSPSGLARFSSPKTVRGIALKCSEDAICIVDPALALIREGRHPVQAASRIDDVRTYGTAMLREPVSLTVGKPVDEAVFSQQAGK